MPQRAAPELRKTVQEYSDALTHWLTTLEAVSPVLMERPAVLKSSLLRARWEPKRRSIHINSVVANKKNNPKPTTIAYLSSERKEITIRRQERKM